MKKRKKRQIILQILFSVGLSIIFWLSIVLSQDYTHLVSFPIKYINYPSKEILVSTLPKKIELTLSGKGIDLLKAIWWNSKDTIQVDLTDALKNGFIKTEDQLNIEKNLKELTLINIFPDSIFLRFEREFQKKVPIFPNLNYALKEGYQFVNPPIFYPDSVTIKGTEEDLKNIYFWDTQPLSLNLMGSGNVEIPLKIQENIGIFPKSVMMKYNIQKFVQGIIVLPIEVENMPLNKTIRLYPNTLSLRYVTPINYFDKLKSSHFRVFIDYNKIDHRFAYVVPEIQADTHLVKSFYPTPKGIKYIVRNL